MYGLTETSDDTNHEGPREVLVGMADAVRLVDCSPSVAVTTG
jgi:hypothetical protein